MHGVLAKGRKRGRTTRCARSPLRLGRSPFSSCGETWGWQLPERGGPPRLPTVPLFPPCGASPSASSAAAGQGYGGAAAAIG